MHIVLVNGPPGSGKDEIGKMFSELAHCYVTKFAKMVKDSCHKIYGLDVPHDHFEKTKNDSRMEFFGKTPRQIYIAFSETFMKPLHGLGIFGHFTIEDIKKNHKGEQLIVITDNGFVSEAQVLANHFGYQNITIIQVRREGHTFERDSRNFVYVNGIANHRFINNSSLESLRNKVAAFLDYMIESKLVPSMVKK